MSTVLTDNVLFKKQKRILIPSAEVRTLFSVPIMILSPNGVGEKFWSIDLGSVALRKLAGAIPYDFDIMSEFILAYDSAGAYPIMSISSAFGFNVGTETQRKILQVLNPEFFVNQPVYLLATVADANVGDADAVLSFEYSEKNISAT